MSCSDISAALKIWLLVVQASFALQSQPAQQQRIQDEVDGEGQAWKNLKHAFETDKGISWQSCSSQKYKKYFNALPALDFENLEIPPNSKILFYGHSMLHQVLDNIVVANKNSLIRDGPFGGYEGYNMHLKKNCEPGVHYDGWLTRWSFKTNSTILEIQNSALLQTNTPENKKHLKWYLDFHGPFDFAVFMNPHEKCFFPKDECGGRDHDYHSDRKDTDPLWQVIEANVGKERMFEVEAWSTVKRQSFHADEANVISSHDILAGDACNHDDNCDATKLDGHQCQPGKLAKVAESVMQKIQQVGK